MKYCVEYKYEELIEVVVEAGSDEEAEVKGLSHARLAVSGTDGTLICADLWEG